MEIIPSEELKQQLKAKEQFDKKQKFFNISLFIATSITTIIFFIEAVQLFEVNLMEYLLNALLLLLSPIYFVISLSIYVSPVLTYNLFKKTNRNKITNYISIANQLTKPTTAKYRARKVFLTFFYILGIVSTLGNITLFIIEILL